MGNVQSPSSYSSSSPTSFASVPSRPFEKHGNMKSCFRNAMIVSLPTPTTVVGKNNNTKNKLTNYSGSRSPSSSSTTTTLMQLILLKDWQRVLIRATLFPNEIDTVCIVKLYGIQWKLLPLHLACALKPPTKVINVLLSSTTNMNSTNLASIPVKKRHSRKKRLSKTLKMVRGGGGSGGRHRFVSSSKSVVSARKELLSQRGSASKDNSNSIDDSSSFLDDDSSFGSVTTTGTNDNYKNKGYIHRNNNPGANYGGLGLVGRRFIKGRGGGRRGGGADKSLISLEESIGDNRSFATRSFATSTHQHHHHRAGSTVGESTNTHHKEGTSSLCSFLDKTGIMLQLTETGGIAPIPVQQCNTNKTPVSKSSSPSSIPQNDTHSLTADDDDDDDDNEEDYYNHGTAASEGNNDKISTTATLEIASNSILEAAAAGDESPLLPIHIACLYQASPSTIQLLLQKYPMGSLSTFVGMLPIHIIAAQWKVEPIESSHGIVIPSAAFDELLKLMNNNTTNNNGGGGGPNGINPNNLTDSDEWYTYQSLRVMQQQFPELIFAKSANHKMSPTEYVEEVMDNGPIKDECLVWLKDNLHQQRNHHQVHERNNNNVFRTTENHVNTTQDADGNLEMVPVEIHCLSSITAPTLMSAAAATTTSSSSSNASSPPFVPTESKIYNLFLERNWQEAIDMIESDPKLVKEWHYGIDHNNNQTKTKTPRRRSRFSNDMNNGNHGDYDEEEEDPILWKRLALHLACTVPGGPPIGLLNTLIEIYPAAVGCPDPHNGSIPLHLACQYAGSSSLPIVRSLIKAKSASTKAVDSRGRLPLHWAILSAAPYAVVEFLVQHDPSSILCPDQDGKTPLQYAHYSYPEGSPVVGLLEVVWM